MGWRNITMTNPKLDRFVKFIENGGIVTDVTLYNCLYTEMKEAIEKAEKYDKYENSGQDGLYSNQKIEIQNLKSQLEDMKEIVKAYNESKLTKQLEQYKSKYGELK